MDANYSNAEGLLAKINEFVTPIGLDASWSSNNLQLDAQDNTGAGNITIGGTDADAVLNSAAGTDTAGVAETFETYVITISGEKALKAYTVTLTIDAGSSDTEGVFAVPVDMTAAQLAAAIAAEINDSTPTDLYTFLSSDYTTATAANKVTITADSSATGNDYTNTIVFAAD